MILDSWSSQADLANTGGQSGYKDAVIGIKALRQFRREHGAEQRPGTSANQLQYGIRYL